MNEIKIMIKAKTGENDKMINVKLLDYSCIKDENLKKKLTRSENIKIITLALHELNAERGYLNSQINNDLVLIDFIRKEDAKDTFYNVHVAGYNVKDNIIARSYVASADIFPLLSHGVSIQDEHAFDKFSDDVLKFWQCMNIIANSFARAIINQYEKGNKNE